MIKRYFKATAVWNTVYLTEAIKILKGKGELKEELLSHISPLGSEHINLLGEYTFDLKKAPRLNNTTRNPEVTEEIPSNFH